MSAPADASPASPQIKGVQVCWGLAGGPKFTGHLQQTANLTDSYKQTEEFADTDGITESIVFNDAMTEGDFELIVKDGVPLPAPSTMLTETDTGNSYLILTRGRTWTNNSVTRCRFTIKRGEGALFA